VQQDRVEVEIVGWGDGEESWSIDYAALPGDPTGPQVWRDLDAYLARPRDGLTVSACCVDSGYLAEQVQRWCHDRRGRRIWAIKGVSGPQRPVWPKRGSRGRKGTGWRVWLVGVDNAKDVLWRRWPIGRPGVARWPARVGGAARGAVRGVGLPGVRLRGAVLADVGGPTAGGRAAA